MQKLDKIVEKRAEEIIKQGRRSELEVIQQEIERLYHSKVKAVKIYPNGNLLLEVESASLAHDIFMRQQDILNCIKSILPVDLVKSLRTKVV